MLPVEIVESIKKSLEKITGKSVKMTSSGEIESRCPFCGGSLSRVFKRQFYLGVSQAPFLFYCFRCQAKGTLADLIRFLSSKGFTLSLPEKAPGRTSEKVSEGSRSKGETSFWENYIAVEGTKSKLCDRCREYLLQRIGSFITQETPLSLKNEIFDWFFCCKDVSRIFSKPLNMIGVPSAFASYMILRSNSLESKFFKYTALSGKNDRKPKDFPVLFYENNASGKDTNVVIFAEGVFTGIGGLLQLYNTLFKEYSKLFLFITSGKSNYSSCFEFVPVFLRVTNPEEPLTEIYEKTDVFVLSDNDVEKEYYQKKVAKKISLLNRVFFVKGVNIVYPEKYKGSVKDFADPVSSITRFVIKPEDYEVRRINYDRKS